MVGGLKGCETYIDNVIMSSDSWREHISQLRALLSRFLEDNLIINLAKSEFSHAEVAFLSHVVRNGQVKPVLAKILCIINY